MTDRNRNDVNQDAGPQSPETTGRFLVLLRQDAIDEGVKELTNAAGLSAVRSKSAGDEGAMPSDGMLVFDEIGVAVASGAPDQLGRINAMAGNGSAVLAVEPERVVHVLGGPGGLDLGDKAGDYLQGYRDAVNELVERLLPPSGEAERAVAAAEFDESFATWGLQATRVVEGRCTGKGVRVAVLDTGFDTSHPDFAGRSVTLRSFIAGQSPQDGNGHGTHCIGTACGPRTPTQLPRYGVAYECEIFAGKVLSNQGSGNDAGILAGINWAIAENCRVISMSLGAAAFPGQPHSAVYEAVAMRALAARAIIIAAASNDSQRPGHIAPVGHPANCPSIMAVAAVDRALQVARFSCGGVNPNGGEVNIAGPGVDVHSSWMMPTKYRSIQGTSMATPHVAGIAALYIQQSPGISANDLWTRLETTARRLPLPARDVGVGLVQAPRC